MGKARGCDESSLLKCGKALEKELVEVFYKLWKSNEKGIIPEEHFSVVSAIIDNHLLLQGGYHIDHKELNDDQRIAAIANQRAIEKVKAEAAEEAERRLNQPPPK